MKKIKKIVILALLLHCVVVTFVHGEDTFVFDDNQEQFDQVTEKEEWQDEWQDDDESFLDSIALDTEDIHHAVHRVTAYDTARIGFRAVRMLLTEYCITRPKNLALQYWLWTKGALHSKKDGKDGN